MLRVIENHYMSQKFMGAPLAVLSLQLLSVHLLIKITDTLPL